MNIFKKLMDEVTIEKLEEELKKRLDGLIVEKKEKKIFDVVTSTAVEKSNTDDNEKLYRGIRDELARFIHSDYQKSLKNMMSKYDFPRELRAKMKEIFVPLGDVPEDLSIEYAKKLTSYYSIFKKYVETKKNVYKKQQQVDVKDFPLGRIKVMIGAGKSLQDIADEFGVPKTTLAYKLKNLYGTSYSVIKKKMGG